MTQVRARAGRAGESAAADVYLQRGFRIVARNWRCKAGEIDLVAAQGDLLVFCEVKTRSVAGFGAGYEAVTRSKQIRIRRLAEMFLFENRLSPERVRFDVASVTLFDDTRCDVQIFDDAF